MSSPLIYSLKILPRQSILVCLKSLPIFIVYFLYKKGQDFLDIQYTTGYPWKSSEGSFYAWQEIELTNLIKQSFAASTAEI